MMLRIKFRKYGPIRFIGHLDVMRYFQKLNRRAGLDVAYSGGFSPHQIMSFAAPLGVGLESNGEYMDLQVHSLVSCADVRERMNAVGVEGMEVVDVKILPEDAGNAMASVAAAAYTVRFREGRTPRFLEHLPMEQALRTFLERESIPVAKETKKGVRQVDLRPGIYELSWDGAALHMLLDASSGGNIKPALVLQALLDSCGERLMENALRITREDAFTQVTDAEGKPHRVSLNDIGMDDAQYAARTARISEGPVQTAARTAGISEGPVQAAAGTDKHPGEKAGDLP